jgi:hypothetical protein
LLREKFMSSRFAVGARLAVVAAAQGGAFSRVQAMEAGFGASQIERRVRGGVWLRTFPSVYLHATAPRSAAARDWGVVLWAGPDSVLAHSSAAAIWRIRPASQVSEVIVPATRGPRAEGVNVHRVARLREVDVMRVRGLPVTTPVRTIVDLATVLDPDDLGATLEAAIVLGLVTVRAVGAGLDAIGSSGRPGAARLRALLAAFGSGRVRPSARMAG